MIKLDNFHNILLLSEKLLLDTPESIYSLCWLMPLEARVTLFWWVGFAIADQ